MRRESRPVRLLEVAARAGVSPITVSRAIRSPAKVSPLTRQRVAQAIDEIGYVPNQIAGSLASNRTNLVVALIPTIANSLFADTVQGLTEVLHEHGLHLAIGNTGHSVDEEESLIAAFLAQRPCAMLLHGTVHTPRARKLLSGAGITVIETGGLVARPVDVVVSYSHFASAKAMTRHLLASGYRRIALIGWNARERTREAQLAYREALAEASLPFDPALLLDLPHTFDGGTQAVAALMELETAADAAFFLGVNSAVGAILECERRRIRVPERLAIASFDDTDLTRLTMPPLTCLAIPRREVGRRAAQIIVERLAGTFSGAPVVDLGFRLIRRAST
jgi:LacI family gluconate utilization system Gnt-I transcriptional repressor